MAILQGILGFGLLIGFFVGVCYLSNKLIDLIQDKIEDKPEIIITTDGGKWLIDQLCLGIRAKCDYIQDDGVFRTYSPDYTAWESNFKYGNIRDLSSYIEQKRIMPYYELVLQTNTPLEHITSLDKEIVYRIIVLNKYNKENEPMDEKQKILNDIEEAQRKLDEARKKLDEYNTGYKRWEPKKDELYWYVNSRGKNACSHFCPIYIVDTDRYQNFNCFQTEQEAETEADKILVRRQLEDIAKRLNKGRKIEWNSNEQLKWCIELYGNKIVTNFYYHAKTQGAVYCLDDNFLDVAKREIGEDKLIKYIRGEG